MNKPKVLILCTGNSCRSHMAEGILRHAAGDLFEIYSAGSKPAGYVHPKAIEALSEIGIDISDHTSKHLDQFLDAGINTVVTVCGNADQACPAFPGKVDRFHWGFEDPPRTVGVFQQLKRQEVVERGFFDVKIRAFAGAPDGILSIGQDGQILQPEEVHFEETEVFRWAFRVLGGEVTFLQGDGDQVGDRLVGDDDAASVFAGVAHHALDHEAVIDDLFGDRSDWSLPRSAAPATWPPHR